MKISRKEYCKKYYKEHREYFKKYHQLHKNETSEYNKQYREKHKEKLNKNYKKYIKKMRQEALRILGNKCFLCGQNRKLEFHKKDGQPHNSGKAIGVLRNPEEFVLLCIQPCHRGVHFCLKFLDMKWEEFEEMFLIRKINYE